MMETVKKALRAALPESVLSSLHRLRRPEKYLYLDPVPTYNADQLVTWHNCDFLTDPRFVAAYAAGERTGSWKGADIRWRAQRWAPTSQEI